MAKNSKTKGFFIKPKNGTEAGKVLLNAAIGAGERGGGALLAGWVSKGLVKETVPAVAHGPVLTLVGILGEAFINEPNTNRVFQGIQTYGVQATVANLVLKDKAAQVGLSGVEDLGEIEDPEELGGWQDQYGRGGMGNTPSVFAEDPLPMGDLTDLGGSDVPEGLDSVLDNLNGIL